MFRMNGMSRAQEAHDCRDAGVRATQEQLPRSDWFSFALLLKLKARAYMDVFTASPGKLIHIPAPPILHIRDEKPTQGVPVLCSCKTMPIAAFLFVQI